ncbi:MAG: RagB/SusD family nutrient uptake outer membrane protein, partial [Sediminibacterium sp.]
MNTKYGWFIAVTCFFMAVTIVSCHKLVEIPSPVGYMSSDNVYTSDETAIATLTGIYLDMSKPKQGGFVGIDGISAVLGISADELDISEFASLRAQRYFHNDLSPIGNGYENWQPLYNYIFRCNSIIEGLSEVEANILTPSVRKHLMGEAKFLRAFCYFYLVNIFGDVPMPQSTDYKVNQILSNSPKGKVYEFIIADLKEANDLLSENFLDPSLKNITSERVRPTKWAAASLLARVYMFTGQYSSAEEQASLVISNVNKFNLTALNDVFKKNSNEAIWQLQPVAVNYNTEDGKTFIIPSFESSSMAGPSGASPFYLSKEQLMAFETGDRRKILGNWVDTTIYTVTASPLVRDTVYYVNKYKKNLPDLAITGTNAYQNMTEY